MFSGSKQTVASTSESPICASNWSVESSIGLWAWACVVACAGPDRRLTSNASETGPEAKNSSGASPSLTGGVSQLSLRAHGQVLQHRHGVDGVLLAAVFLDRLVLIDLHRVCLLLRPCLCVLSLRNLIGFVGEHKLVLVERLQGPLGEGRPGTISRLFVRVRV